MTYPNLNNLLQEVGDKVVEVNKLIQKINCLYDYGEIDIHIYLTYLEDMKLLKYIDNKAVITKNWINFSGKVAREDFVSSLVCYYPPLLDYLLWKVYKEAYSIGQSGDGLALYEFIDNIPKFAKRILEIRNIKMQEAEEVKSFFGPIFKGYPQYGHILSRLRLMQFVEETEDTKVEMVGKTPNEIWVHERKISSSINLKPLDFKNRYTLTPYEYVDYEVSEDIKEILSHPWKTFMIIIGMLISEYKAEGFSGVSIRPIDKKNPYTEQETEVFIYDLNGKENKVGSLKEFVESFCKSNRLYLFPDKAPEVDSLLFSMMDTKQFVYGDGEYLLNSTFDDRLYSAEGIIIKNRSRKFKAMLKEYVEELRRKL